jgi:hypothetical protein
VEHAPADVSGCFGQILYCLLCSCCALGAVPTAVALETCDPLGELLPDTAPAEKTEEFIVL